MTPDQALRVADHPNNYTSLEQAESRAVLAAEMRELRQIRDHARRIIEAKDDELVPLREIERRVRWFLDDPRFVGVHNTLEAILRDLPGKEKTDGQ